jgi:hypothetical protein
MQHVWQSVWAALSDESLENRLRHYYWLTILTPHLYLARFLGLVKEANRRGKPEIVKKVEQWVRNMETRHPFDGFNIRPDRGWT